MELFFLFKSIKIQEILISFFSHFLVNIFFKPEIHPKSSSDKINFADESNLYGII